MPSSASVNYADSGTINPVIFPERATPASVRLGVSLSLAAGTPLGQQIGNNEIQRLTITGTPTGGTFTITYGGQTTAAIAYNATADLIRQRLEALSSIGSGNVRVWGGQLPTYEVYVEFIGDLGLTNVAAMTTTDSLTGGSSPASAVTTLIAGAAGDGLFYPCAKTKLAIGAAPAGTAGAGGALAAGDYNIAYTFANPSGESALSPVVTKTVTANQKVTMDAVTLASGAQWINWYVSVGAGNPVMRRLTSNDGTSFDILRAPNPNAQLPPGDMNGTGFVAYNGTQICSRILKRQSTTDSAGYVTYGAVAGTADNNATTRLTADAWAGGFFALSDLTALTPAMAADLQGLFYAGGWGNTSSIIALGR